MSFPFPDPVVLDAAAVIRSPRGLGTTICAFGGPGVRTLFISESDTGTILKAEFPADPDISGAPMFAGVA